MISQELLNMLVCPETHQRVQAASEELLQSLNAKIDQSGLSNRAGTPVEERLEGALVRADGRFAYPVRNDIPVMLIEESIPLNP